MNSKKSHLLLLGLLVLSIGVVSFRFANAQESNKATNVDQMEGTFLISFESGTERGELKALLNPQVVEFGGKKFLRGTESGAVKDIINETVFSGQLALIPLDRIVVIQQINTE